MNPTISSAIFLAAILSLPAQQANPSTQETRAAPPTSARQAAIESMKLRTEAVAAVLSGAENPEAILLRLRMTNPPAGATMDREADFAFAAIDIGQRLVPLGKAAAAEEFFLAAEGALEGLIARTSDQTAVDKAHYLRRLAMIRSRYLGKVAQAKSDLEQALILQPDDPALQRARTSLARGHAEVVKPTADKGVRP